MSYLARLKQQISPVAPKCEPTKATKAPSVGFVGSLPEPLRDISDDWREIEGLLAIVGPACPMSNHEYAELRECARGDLANAITCYRSMAAEMKRKSIATGGE